LTVEEDKNKFQEYCLNSLKQINDKVNECQVQENKRFEERCALDEKYVNEIKNSLMEITLDSTSLFAQKFDDLVKVLKLQTAS